MTCPFCAEAIPREATKCHHCGEALRKQAVLRFELDHVVIVERGDLPDGVCFKCAAARPTVPRPLASGVVAVPLCAACRDASVTLIARAVVLFGVFMAVTWASTVLPQVVANGLVGLTLVVLPAVFVGLLVVDGRRGVRAAVRAGQDVLLLPDAGAVQRALSARVPDPPATGQ